MLLFCARDFVLALAPAACPQVIQRSSLSLPLGVQLVGSVPVCLFLWEFNSWAAGIVGHFLEAQRPLRTRHGSQVADILLFSVITNKMIRLRLHNCVFPASLSSAHWSEHRGLGRALSFRIHDVVHFVLLAQILHLHTYSSSSSGYSYSQSWYWSMVHMNWQLVVAGEVALVPWAEFLKKFQAHLKVLHRVRLNPWTCASWSLTNHSASPLPSWFFFPSVSVDFVPVDFLFSVAFLNGHSRDSVVPRLLTPHPHLERSETGSAGTAGKHVEIHVEVLAHATSLLN